MDIEQPPKGASLEDRAANTLNAVMIMLLSAAAALLMVGSCFIQVQRALAGGQDFSWPVIAGLGTMMAAGFLFACRGMRLGYRMLFKRDREG
jgi:hypothetical protein